MAIGDQYRKLESGQIGVTIEVSRAPADESLPVNFEVPSIPVLPERTAPIPVKTFGKDPFFDQNPFKEEAPSPFQLFNEGPAEPSPTDSQGIIIHARNPMAEQVQPLETRHTRTLVLGLIRLLQRRGILGQDELQRFIAKLIEQGELVDADR
jgi:hypothetical protein